MRRWTGGLIFAWVAGCGGPETTPTLDASADMDGATSSLVVDARGGSFEVDGVRLAFPVGAVDRRVEIRVTSVEGPAPAGYVLRSRLYRFEPEGLTFLSPVQVTLPFVEGAGAHNFYWSLPEGGYEARTSVRLGSTLTASITHFSTGFVGAPILADAGLDSSVDGGADGSADAGLDGSLDGGGSDVADVPIDLPRDAPPEVAVDVPFAMVTPARPLLPRTGARALSNRPRVRWALPAGVTGARLTFCRDRAQTDSCTVTDLVGDAGQPAAPLAAGVWFWSLQGRSTAGVGSARSAVWRLTVPTTAGATQGQWGGEYDANGDGISDLPRVESGVAARVHLGGATGISATPISLEPPWDATGFGNAWAAGDIDADGYTDLAIAAAGSTRVYLYRGSATGPITTTPALLQGPAQFGERLSMGDANGDGFSDLLVTCATCNAAGFLFLGSATGLATTPVSVLSGAGQAMGARARFAGDLNGDGYEDFVLAQYPCMFVLNGASGPGATAVLAGMSRCLPLGDVQNDGFADVAVGDQIRLGGASGLASTGVTDDRLALVLGASVTSPPIDVDADGDDDVAVAVDDRVSLLLGAVPAAQSVIPGWLLGERFSAVPLGDLNGDGLPDWVSSSDVHYAVAGTSPGVRTLEIAVPGGTARTVLNAGDLNGDGRDELLITARANSTSAYVFTGTAGGFGATPQVVTVPAWTGTLSAASLGDLDRDGLDDLAVSLGPRSVRVIYGTRGTLGSRSADLVMGSGGQGSAVPVGVGDVTGDGHRDVLVIDGTSSMGLFRGSPSGPGATPTAVGLTLSTGLSLSGVLGAWGVGDVNSDGAGDVVLFVQYLNRFTQEQALVPCFGGMSGLTCNFGGAVVQRTPHSDAVGPIGDVNGDGRMEMGFDRSAYRFDGTRWVMQGVAPPTRALCPVGDQNGDGVDDTYFLVGMDFEVRAGARPAGLTTTVLRRGGTGFPIDQQPACAATLDRDGDRRRELVMSLPTSMLVAFSAPGGAWRPLP